MYNWVLFLLWLHPFILSRVISPLNSSSIIEHLPTWGVHLSVSYLFAFSYCSWGSQGKNAEVICHSLLQWTTFCQTSLPWPIHLGWPHTAWLSFIELDKAVVQVIRLASLWLWFQCVCPLMPSLSTYHLTWVSLTFTCKWDSSWAISNPKRWCCENAAHNMSANLENSAVATRLEKVSFHSNPKERQCQRMAMPKNAQTTTQLHSSHTLVK